MAAMKNHHVSKSSCVCAAFLLGAIANVCCAATNAQAASDGTPILTFATLGDSRAEPGETASAQDQRWLQNTPVFAQIIDGIRAQSPQLVFFNGDMIMGYSADKALVEREYAYWRGMIAGLIEHGTYVVPVPGNHETQRSDGKGLPKLARADSEQLWRENMGDLILDATRFERAVGVAPQAFDPVNHPTRDSDGNVSDQAQLSYSFDAKGLHFVVINSDAVGQDSRAPVHWLEADLTAAQKRGVARSFVFGHRPAYTYNLNGGEKKAGFDADADNQKAFWDAIEKHRAIYFCGHQHILHLMQPRKDEGGQAWQITVGSGGSPLAAAKLPPDPQGDSGSPLAAKPPTRNSLDREYAWVLAKVYKSGVVRLEAWGFDRVGQTSRRLDVQMIKR